LLMQLLARSAAHPHFFLTLVPLDGQSLLRPHRQYSACKLSFRQPSKLKGKKLRGPKKSCRKSFKLRKNCCDRPRMKWRASIVGLRKLMHCCELSWIYKNSEVWMVLLRMRLLPKLLLH
jgi:hypothetical protein